MLSWDHGAPDPACPLATFREHRWRLLDDGGTCCISSVDRDRHLHFADRDMEAAERVEWEEPGPAEEGARIGTIRCALLCAEPSAGPAVLRYFSALSSGDPLPVKDRIEMPVATQKTDTGLTQGLLRVLHKQVREGLHRLGPPPAESLAWPWPAALGESGRCYRDEVTGNGWPGFEAQPS